MNPNLVKTLGHFDMPESGKMLLNGKRFEPEFISCQFGSGVKYSKNCSLD